MGDKLLWNFYSINNMNLKKKKKTQSKRESLFFCFPRHDLLFCFSLTAFTTAIFSKNSYTPYSAPNRRFSSYLNMVEHLAAKYNKQQLQMNSKVVLYMLNV